MWTLNSMDNTYYINAPSSKKKLTWIKVSSEALKFLKSKHRDVPRFIPMVTKNSKVKDRTTLSYRYGLQLYDLTRYAFDKMKENPDSTLISLFEKVHSKSKRIKPCSTIKQVQFGDMNCTETSITATRDSSIHREIKNIHKHMKQLKNT